MSIHINGVTSVTYYSFFFQASSGPYAYRYYLGSKRTLFLLLFPLRPLFLRLRLSLRFCRSQEERCKNVLARAISGARRSPFSRYHSASPRCDPTRCNAIQRDAMCDVIHFSLQHRSQQLTYKSSHCAPVINNSLPGNVQLPRCVYASRMNSM